MPVEETVLGVEDVHEGRVGMAVGVVEVVL